MNLSKVEREELTNYPFCEQVPLNILILESKRGQTSAPQRMHQQSVQKCPAKSRPKWQRTTLLNVTRCFYWRPHGDSNPGYRRERAMS